jgi:integrase
MPRRKRAAWGSLTKVDDGTWRIRFWGKGPDGQYRRRSCTVRGSRKDAERKRAELMLAHSDEAPCPTVGDVWRSYALPDINRLVEDGDLAPLTKRTHETAWRLHIAPRWEDVQCDAVRPLHVQQWISGLGYSQAQAACSTFSRILDYAVRYELIGHNPMREKYLMPSKSTISRADKGVWSLAELGPVWKSIRGEWWEAAFLLAAFGGCRLGESLAPLASDVEIREVDDVTVAVVRITGQIPSSGIEVVRTKTAQSVRPVVLVGKPAKRIAEIVAEMPPDCPLTNDGMGGHQRQSRMKGEWRARKMKHPFRNLRNGWQTWMRWELKVEPHFIEAMMGHKLPGVTGAHYDRPTADMFCEVMVTAYKNHRFDTDWDD